MRILAVNPSYRRFLPIGINKQPMRGYAIGGAQNSTMKNWVYNYPFSTETDSALAATHPSSVGGVSRQQHTCGTSIYLVCGATTLESINYGNVVAFRPATEGSPSVVLTAILTMYSDGGQEAGGGCSSARVFLNRGFTENI